MNKTLAKISIILFVLFVSTLQSVAFSAPLQLPTNTTILTGAAAFAGCKTNFTVTVIDDLISGVPSLSSLSSQVTLIQNDQAQLNSLAATENLTNFKAYYSGTYDPALVSIKNTVEAARANATISNSTLSTLKTEYNTSLATYQICSFNATKTYALGRVSEYNLYISTLRGDDANVSSRLKISTSSLDQVLNNAQSTVVTPLGSAVNSAKNTSQIMTALNMYCLFNGCSAGINFHLDANYYLAVLTLAYQKLQSVPTALNSSASSSIQSNLNIASSTLTAFGTNEYTGNQATTIFDALQGAFMTLKSVVTALL